MATGERHIRADLDDLGLRINGAIAEYRHQGLLHGPERKAAAEFRLRHGELARDASAGHERQGELAHDIAVLTSTFERWLARVDGHSERHRG